MRTIILFCITLLISTYNLVGQWKIVNEGINHIFHCSDFINKDTGWMVGHGIICKTMDGGMNWTAINDNLNFHNIDFINDSVGWAIGNRVLMNTTDGGQNWTQQKTDIDRICAVTEKIVYVIQHEYSEPSFLYIYKTTDGGEKWMEVFSETTVYLNEITFLNPDTGIAVGLERKDYSKFFLRTFDGGETWDNITLAEFNYIYDIHFLHDSLGYFIAFSDTLGKYLICKSSDMFDSWTVVLENNYPIDMCHFFNDEIAISMMEDSIGKNIYKSIDGGTTWEKSSNLSLPNFNLYEFYFDAENTVHIIGFGFIRELRPTPFNINKSAQIMITSSDTGNTWVYKEFAYPFNDVYFIDRDKGFITGGNYTLHFAFGNVFMTQDGGNTWNVVFDSEGCMSSSIVFRNNVNGFITCHNGGGFQTLNGGLDWDMYQFTNDFEISLSDIFFVDEHSGYAIDGGSIYKFIEESESWEEYYNVEPYGINSLFFINDTIGWAVGSEGCVLRHSAAKSWEKAKTPTDLPLNKVFFPNGIVGYIAGGYSNDDGFVPIFLKTTDKGISWTEMNINDYFIHDLHFVASQQGWIVGEDSSGYGVLLETYDGGNSWNIVFDSLTVPLKAIHIKDSCGWAVGEAGLILKYDSIPVQYDSIPVGINDYITVNQNDLTSLQNYPNPFLLKTIIGYQLSVPGNVEIIVYDLTGRKITTLLKENQPAGIYTVEWNASGMKPGIYLCELKTTGNREVVKMILLK